MENGRKMKETKKRLLIFAVSGGATQAGLCNGQPAARLFLWACISLLDYPRHSAGDVEWPDSTCGLTCLLYDRRGRNLIVNSSHKLSCRWILKHIYTS